MFKIVGAALRGALKGFPLINAITEAVRNIRAKKAIDTNEITEAINVTLKPIGDNETATGQPHNWISIAFQFITVAVILWAFFTKQVTAESVISILRAMGGGL